MNGAAPVARPGGVVTALAVVLVIVFAAGASAQEPAGTFFPADRLNAGLPPATEPLNLATPQAAVETFLRLGDAERFEVAAHALDLSLVPEEERALFGPVLAGQLHDLLRRRLLIDWGRLPDRADGMRTRAEGQDDPMVGEERRSITLARLEVEGRTIDLRIERLKPPDGEPRWLFAAQTVAEVPPLYRAYGPGELARDLPDWLRADDGFARWKLALAPLALTLALLAGGIVYRVGRWAGRRGLFPGTAAAPAAIATAAGLLYATTRAITFGGGVNAVLTPTFAFVALVAIVWLVFHFIDRVSERAVARYIDHAAMIDGRERARMETQFAVLRRVALLVAGLLACGLVVQLTGLGSVLSLSILATAGVLSAIVGLALQPLLSNLFAGIQVALAQPARIGDTVMFRGEFGTVEDIAYSFVQIRTWDQRRLIVPVRQFIDEPFENWTRGGAAKLKTIVLHADHRVDVEALRRHFADLLRDDPDWDGASEPATIVLDCHAETVEIRFLCSAGDPSAAWDLQCRLRERMLDHLRTLEGGRYLPRHRLHLEEDEDAPPRRSPSDARPPSGPAAHGDDADEGRAD